MNAPDLAGAGDPAWTSRVRDSLAGSGAALLRTIPGGTPFDAAFRDANNSLDPPFTQLGDPIPSATDPKHTPFAEDASRARAGGKAGPLSSPAADQFFLSSATKRGGRQ